MNDLIDNGIIGVVQRVGDGWRVLVGEVGGRRPRIIASRELNSAHGGLDAFFDQHNVGHVLCVLPAGSVICRTCTLPDATEQQLDQALRLQAEAHLLGIAPSHRLGMAVLHATPNETTRTGLILAWPEAAQITPPTTSRSITYVPAVAALAAITNGHRPADPVIWVDRKEGSVAISLSHANGVAFRSTRERIADRAAWAQHVGQVLAETGMNAGHTDAFIDGIVDHTTSQLRSEFTQDASLLLPDELLSVTAGRVDGQSDDANWWAEYGIVAGALLARSDQLWPLTDLVLDEPIQNPSRIRGVVDWLARPRTAVAAVAMLLIVLALGPLVTNWARVKVLETRHGEIQTELASLNEYDRELKMYGELETKAWSMSKLLADVASNTPPGIELEDIRIEHGQSINLGGYASREEGKEGRELIELMVNQLGESRIFEDISWNWGDSSAYGRYPFSLSARVVRPHYRPAYPEELDFGKWTYQHRVDGKAPGEDYPDGQVRVAAAPDTNEPETTDQPDEVPADTVANGRDRDPNMPRGGKLTQGPRGGGRSVINNGGEPVPDPGEIPEPLSETQIAGMSIDEAREWLVRVSKARKYNDDEEIDARLKNEFTMLMAHIRELTPSRN